MRAANEQFPFNFTKNPFGYSVSFSSRSSTASSAKNIPGRNPARNEARYAVRAQELQMTTDVTSAHRNLITQYQTVQLQEQNRATAQQALELARSGTGSAPVPSSRCRRRGRISSVPAPTHQRDLRIPQVLRRARTRGRQATPLDLSEDGHRMSKKMKWGFSARWSSLAWRSSPRRPRGAVKSPPKSGSRPWFARPRRLRHSERPGAAPHQGRRRRRHLRAHRQALAVKEGQMVKRGDFLLQIDPEQYEAAVQRAEAGCRRPRHRRRRRAPTSSRPSAVRPEHRDAQDERAALVSDANRAVEDPDGSERGPARGVHT